MISCRAVPIVCMCACAHPFVPLCLRAFAPSSIAAVEDTSSVQSARSQWTCDLHRITGRLPGRAGAVAGPVEAHEGHDVFIREVGSCSPSRHRAACGKLEGLL